MYETLSLSQKYPTLTLYILVVALTMSHIYPFNLNQKSDFQIQVYIKPKISLGLVKADIIPVS